MYYQEDFLYYCLVKKNLAYSIEEYEKKAVEIGSNKLLLEQIKNNLGQYIKKTSIFNMTNYVKNLEKGYLEIFKRELFFYL